LDETEGEAMKEAYEIARITDIKPGDVVKVSNLDEYPIFKVSQVRTTCKGAFLYEIKPEFGYSVDRMYFSDEGCIYRQLPPERNPDVLERALRNELVNVASELGYDITDLNAMVSEAVENARKELESEARR
jgi:hypothetical protein